MVDTERSATTLPAPAQNSPGTRGSVRFELVRHVFRWHKSELDTGRFAALRDFLEQHCGLGVCLRHRRGPDVSATREGARTSLAGAQRQPRSQGVVRTGHHPSSDDRWCRGPVLRTRIFRSKSDLVHGLLFRAIRHRRRLCPSFPRVVVSRDQEDNRLLCCSELRHVTRSLLVVGRHSMGERFRGSSISGPAVARRQLLVDWARLVRTAAVPVEDAKGVPARAGRFRERCRRLGTRWRGCP